MIERWSAVAVLDYPQGSASITEAYLAPIIEGLQPYAHHIPSDGRIFAFADGYDTPEGALAALTTYLATVDRPQSRAPLTERNHLS